MKFKILLFSICLSYSFSAELPNSLIEKKDIVSKEPKVSLSNSNKIVVEPLIEKKGDLKKAFDKIPYNESELKIMKDLREERAKVKEARESKNILDTVVPFNELKAKKLSKFKLYDEAKLCIEKANDKSQINLCETNLRNKETFFNK